MDFFIGQIIQGGWNFAPSGFATCQGQIMPIVQNQALYSLLGTSFGGDGVTNFHLPDLGGRAMVGTGVSSGGGTVYQLGNTGGAEKATLTVQNMPAHNHVAQFTSTASLKASSTVKANAQSPTDGAVLARTVDGAAQPNAIPEIYAPAGSDANMSLGGLNVAGSVTVGVTGASQPLSILSPYQAVTCAIALQGVYPVRP